MFGYHWPKKCRTHWLISGTMHVVRSKIDVQIFILWFAYFWWFNLSFWMVRSIFLDGWIYRFWSSIPSFLMVQSIILDGSIYHLWCWGHHVWWLNLSFWMAESIVFDRQFHHFWWQNVSFLFIFPHSCVRRWRSYSAQFHPSWSSLVKWKKHMVPIARLASGLFACTRDHSGAFYQEPTAWFS